ncbi:MAG: hypothetical protein AB9903_24550 [Vulcanimicrobiota bacterium]
MKLCIPPPRTHNMKHELQFPDSFQWHEERICLASLQQWKAGYRERRKVPNPHNIAANCGAYLTAIDNEPLTCASGYMTLPFPSRQMSR